MKKIDKEHVLLKIKNKRMLLGYSQDYVAQKLGIKQASYSQIEKGDTRLKIETINKLAILFQCNSLELLDSAHSQDNNPVQETDPIEEANQVIDAMKREIEQNKELLKLYREREKWAKEKEELERNIAKNR
jgi:transcriptional regulator with XRE-family HTH domain